MSTSREAFLERVRHAVAAGNRPGEGADVPARGKIGYQGAGPDLVARFGQELTALGAFPHVVTDERSAAAKVIELLEARSAKRVLLGQEPLLESMGLPALLRNKGMVCHSAAEVTASAWREPFFAADVGIGGVDFLIAETGTIALLAKPNQPRSVSLLPPVYIAVAQRSDLLADLFDLFEQVGGGGAKNGVQPVMPSCLTFITGPSKTGDIELKLVTGVHGPGEVHVVLIDAPTAVS
jgi:L-lactate dehydrogenase complex protein LldG